MQSTIQGLVLLYHSVLSGLAVGASASAIPDAQRLSCVSSWNGKIAEAEELHP
jgi:hypothetical protein